MVKKYFRNSIAGACMAMSLALGASSVGSVAVLAEEPDTELETSSETELKQTEAETQAATEAPATEAPAETEEEAVDETDMTVTQDVMEPTAGGTVKETFNFSYNKAEDTEFKLDVDSALDLTEVEIAKSSPLYDGKMTVMYSMGSADIDINLEKIDLSVYEGITRITIKPADSDEAANKAMFSASFIVKEAKDEIRNTATVTSTLGEASQPMVFSSTAGDEAEEIEGIYTDSISFEAISGVVVPADDSTAEEGTAEEIQDVAEEAADAAVQDENTGLDIAVLDETPAGDDAAVISDESATEEAATETGQSEESTPQVFADTNAVVLYDRDSENPIKGESFNQTVRVQYDNPEDTTITYDVPDSIQLNSIDVDEYCGLFGGKLEVVYQDGKTADLTIDRTISLSGYSGITSLIIWPNANSESAASGKFVLNMQVTSDVETVTCTTTIETTNGTVSESDTFSPAYASVLTPKVQVSAKTIDYGDEGILYISNIGADFNGTSSDLEYIMTDLPSQLEMSDLILPNFNGVESIDVYYKRSGNDQWMSAGNRQPESTVELGGTGYTQIRLVIHPSGMSVKSTSEGQLIMKATNDLDNDLQVSFKGKTTATYGGNSYSKTSDSDACTFKANKTYTIKFDTQGGSSVNSIEAKAGTEVDLATITVPTRSGYVFDYWFTSEGVQYKSNESFTASGNLTLYAHWTAEETEKATEADTGKTDDSSSGSGSTGGSSSGGSSDGSSGGSGSYDSGSGDTTTTTDATEDDSTDETDDTKQNILERALEDADEAAEDEARTTALTDRINAIINNATSDEDEDDDDDSSSSSSNTHTSPSDPETYADWTVKPIFEDIINNLVKMYIQPIDESLIANTVPAETLSQTYLTVETEGAESEEDSDEESEEETEDAGLDIVTFDDLTPDDSEL